MKLDILSPTTWLYQAETLEVLAEMGEEKVAACITELRPSPDADDFYREIARHLKRVLAPCGSVIALLPAEALVEVIRSFSTELVLRARIALWLRANPIPSLQGSGIECKTIVWWVKDQHTPRGSTLDPISVSQRPVHAWEPSGDWSTYALTLNARRGLVLDPFCRSGTVGAACLRSGVPYLGIASDPASFAQARRQIGRGERIPSGVGK